MASSLDESVDNNVAHIVAVRKTSLEACNEHACAIVEVWSAVTVFEQSRPVFLILSSEL